MFCYLFFVSGKPRSFLAKFEHRSVSFCCERPGIFKGPLPGYGNKWHQIRKDVSLLFLFLKARLHMRFFMRFRCNFGAILHTKPAPAYPAPFFSRVSLRRSTAKLAGIGKKGVFK